MKNGLVNLLLSHFTIYISIIYYIILFDGIQCSDIYKKGNFMILIFMVARKHTYLYILFRGVMLYSFDCYMKFVVDF